MRPTLLATIAMLAVGIVDLSAQTVDVPNPSFEEGAEAPTGWQPSGEGTSWLTTGAADGRRAVAVTGTGQSNDYWRSSAIALAPSTVYRLQFRARSLGAQGGTPVTGPVFCNRDLWGIPEKWTEYTSIFVTPAVLRPDEKWLRFGEWHTQGSLAFDDLRLTVAQPVHRHVGSLVLGEGESLQGNDYTFQAPFNTEPRNHSRPLVSHRCFFNSNRWCFGSDSEVIYRHTLPGREQQRASVEVTVNWYASGELVVEVSREGKQWQEVGVVGESASASFDVPQTMLPAEAVWVRLSARAKKRVGHDSDPGSLQVNNYTYRAQVSGAPATARGTTRYIAVTATDPRVQVTLDSFGEGLPGGDNVIVATVRNTTGAALNAQPTVTLRQQGQETARQRERLTLAPGEQTLRLPYEVTGTGEFALGLSLGEGLKYAAETSLFVAELYNSAYGQQLPGSSDALALWWCSSGWKVAQTRPAPKATGPAMLIRAARNEVEAAQLVVRPRQRIGALSAAATALRGPQGATLPKGTVEVLRVRYVPVTRPTDATGVAAPWPDPLPPFRSPVSVEANRNQPLWVRVQVPRDAPAGDYTGAVQLTVDKRTIAVPLTVHVYDFTLPDRMTCSTAFGLSPSLAWRYQNVTDQAQRRAVLDKYLANYSAHHISPYDPAPMDPIRVIWPNTGNWQGGVRDTSQKHGGASSLLVADRSPTGQPSAGYAPVIPIPPEGLRLRFWYKTGETGGRFIVSFNHYDSAEQWMSGRNNNLTVTGTGAWQFFDRTVTSFAKGARYVTLRLWGSEWNADGSPMGEVWYDDLSLTRVDTGAELVEGGDFEPLDPASLVPQFDWSAWDAAMTTAIDRYHFTSFRLPVPGLGGGTFHARTEPSLLGYGEETPQYRTALRNYLQAVETHLREKGWLDEAFVYWFDEPDPKDYAFVMNGFRKLKEYAPGLRRMLTEQVEPELIGGPNLWCPVSPRFDSDLNRERQRAGDAFWWYVCTSPKAPYCTLFIDHPATELRTWLWQTWQRQIEGILVWQSNYWTSSAAYPDPEHPQNPYEDPMGWTSGYNTPAGVKRPWGNGDGRFVYPPEAAADGRQTETVLDGPVDSIRWEMLRDGLEDYEYLAMLKRALDARNDLPPATRQQYQDLLQVPADITTDVTTFTHDPTPIGIRRQALAEALEALGGAGE